MGLCRTVKSKQMKHRFTVDDAEKMKRRGQLIMLALASRVFKEAKPQDWRIEGKRIIVRFKP